MTCDLLLFQAKCYLASISALQLVDSKYAWIVRPQEKQTSTASPQPTEKVIYRNDL